MDDLAGRVIRGYELQRQIGKGGFGAVYAAHQPLVGRDVAIKVILPSYANHPEFIRRFESEAHVVARLEHPFIIPLYDYWREPSSAYLVMRYVTGGSLENLIDQGPADLETTIRVIDQIASALTTAHRAGIVHRDIKPANILLDDDGNAYLADFGIAKYIKEGGAEESDHETVGSPAFLAPEQIMNEPVSPQTDIYAMGLVLLTMLAGQHPYDTQSIMKMLRMQLEEPLPSIFEYRQDLPERIDDIVRWATAKHPQDRYHEIGTMAADLRNLLGGSPIAPTSTRRPTTRDSESHGSPPASTLIIDTDGLKMNPYKGLRSFEEADAIDFFGRETLVAALIDRMAEEKASARFLAVVGPSGSGKSSVVKAGLVPALRRGALHGSAGWFYAMMVPGHTPLKELVNALLSVAILRPENIEARIMGSTEGLLEVVNEIVPSDTELVLLIDQFEEWFTLLDDEKERAHLLKAIHHVITAPESRLRLIVTIRADFYDRPLLYTGFGELMQTRTEVVLPLNPVELERAITGPAERVGLRLDGQLVTAIINDVSSQPGALPLLQFALTELFDRRIEHTLTLSIYRATGGVSGALARRAEELYQQLAPEGKTAARQLFLQLVSLGEGTEDTRRRIDWSVIKAMKEAFPAVEESIELYGRYRLLTFDIDPTTRTPTVEVAHEALIQQWKRLRTWLNDNREDLRIQRRVNMAAREWYSHDQDHSYLATGNRLTQFEEWLNETDLALTSDEQAYIDASLRQRETRLEAERAREAREAALERQRRNVLSALVVVLLIAFVGALALSVVAFEQRSDAQDARQEAEANAEDARQNAREAQIASRNAEANAEEARLNADAARRQELLAQQNATRAERSSIEAQSLSLATSAQVALANNNTDLAILLAIQANNIPTPPPLAQRSLFEAAYAPGTRYLLEGHSNWVRKVVFSGDNQYAASASQDASVILWDVETGRQARALSGYQGQVFAVAFNPASTIVASGGDGGDIIFHDVIVGFNLRRYSAPDTGTLWSLDYNTTGTLLAAGYESGEVIIWSTRTHDIVQRLQVHDARVWDLEFTEGGSRLVTASQDSSATVIAVESGEILVRFDEHPGAVHSVSIQNDRGWVATAGAGNNSIYIWYLRSGEVFRRITGHADQVYDAEFAPNGRELVSSSQDATLRIWDVESGLELERLQGHLAAIRTLAISPTGQMAATGSYDNTVRLWDLENGAVIDRYFGHDAAIYDVDISPDGTRAVSGSWDNAVIIWDVESATVIHRMEGHSNWVRDVAFSPDGRTVISGSYDKTVIVWNAETGEMIRQLPEHDDRIWALAYSPDGTMIAAGSQDGEVRVSDPRSGEVIWQLYGHAAWVRGMDFSPDSTMLVSVSGMDISLRVWDLERGEQIVEMYPHRDWHWMADWSPDGRYIITSASDTYINLIDTTTWQVVRRYEGHTGPVNKVHFAPDSQTFVSGAADGTVRVWDVETGAELRRFTLANAGVWSVAFHPNNEMVISAATDGTLTSWRLSSLIELYEWVATNRYIRSLTCYEREQNRIAPYCDEETIASGR